MSGFPIFLVFIPFPLSSLTIYILHILLCTIQVLLPQVSISGAQLSDLPWGSYNVVRMICLVPAFSDTPNSALCLCFKPLLPQWSCKDCTLCFCRSWGLLLLVDRWVGWLIDSLEGTGWWLSAAGLNGRPGPLRYTDFPLCVPWQPDGSIMSYPIVFL